MMVTQKISDGDAKSAAKYFRCGYSVAEVKRLLFLESGRGLTVIRRRAISEIDPQELANGPLLRADKRTDFGRRQKPKPAPIEQTSILDIVDGHMGQPFSRRRD